MIEDDYDDDGFVSDFGGLNGKYPAQPPLNVNNGNLKLYLHS